MHQHPRPSPRASSPSSAPTNPSRTNNGREGPHSRLGSEVFSYSETEDASPRGGDSLVVVGPTMETRKKLDQILQVRLPSMVDAKWQSYEAQMANVGFHQNFYTKAATIILQSRIATPTVQTKDNNIKVNKWVSFASFYIKYKRLMF